MNKPQYRVFAFQFAFMAAMASSAQTTVEGEVTAKAGVGNATPWGTNVNLKITTPKLTIKPFIGINGVTPYSSETIDDTHFIYSASGDLYNSEFKLKSKGYELMYGTDLIYDINKKNTLSASIKGLHKDISEDGTRIESLDYGLMTHGVASRSVLYSSYRNPLNNGEELEVEAAYVHRTDRAGESLTVKYNYLLETEDIEKHQTAGEINLVDVFRRTNDLYQEANTHMHSLLFDWKRPLAKGHLLDLGVRYDDKTITSADRQLLDDKEVLNEEFEHHTRTAAAYAAYILNLGPVSATARLEYDYTRMQERTLNDLIPMARVQWNINKTNSLTALYGMKLIRPSISFLNPGHIRSAYAIEYGNENLTGTHANNVQLIYNLTGKKAKFTTTLQHIFADDGFCAIWMVKDGMRIATWGNEGVRRAWGLTPEVNWDATSTTHITAKATVLWDKRIAYAINMSKEHWGITTQLAVKQILPCSFSLGAHFDYSEGNTVDLYSHNGRLINYGFSLDRTFLKKHNLVAALSLERKGTPEVILTQGQYTGSYHIYPGSLFGAGVNVSYRF